MDKSKDDTYNKNKIEVSGECLKVIKDDLRTLPCQSGSKDDCLQAESVNKLLTRLETHMEDDYVPLIRNYDLLNARMAIQETIAARTEDKIDTIQKDINSNRLVDKEDIQKLNARLMDKDDIQKLRLDLTTQITKLVTQRETYNVTKTEMRAVIQWILGVAIGSATLYGIVKTIIAALF